MLEDALGTLAHGDFDHRIVVLTVVMVLAGFTSGLIGFGFSFIAALALFFFAPRELFPLLLVLSLVTQLTSMWSLRAEMVPLRNWWPEGPAPFLLGAVIGIPGGLWLLYHLDAAALCELVGAIIVGYSTWALFAGPKQVAPERVATLSAIPARTATAVLGGLIGGFTAAPGTVVAMWANIVGLGKERQRAIVQPFIAGTQLLALVDQMRAPGGVKPAVLIFAAALCVVVVPANLLGVRLFRHIGDTAFKKAVLALLLGMGIALIDKGFHVWGELYTSWHMAHPWLEPR